MKRTGEGEKQREKKRKREKDKEKVKKERKRENEERNKEKEKTEIQKRDRDKETKRESGQERKRERDKETKRETERIAWAYTLLAWYQFIGSDYVGRVPTERKLTRVPAPRVSPQRAKQPATSEYENRSQITDHRRGK